MNVRLIIYHTTIHKQKDIDHRNPAIEFIFYEYLEISKNVYYNFRIGDY